MVLSTLTAISPVDGRYRNKAENLAAYFSEYALIKYRVRVEIEYFITLSEFLPQLSELNAAEVKKGLRKIYQEFTEEDALRVKEIESVTNHDVKAVEYFIKEKTNHFLAEKYHEFIHFGLTSQDINNTSVPLSIKDALQEVYYPGLEEVIGALKKYAEEWMDIPMLAKTHGLQRYQRIDPQQRLLWFSIGTIHHSLLRQGASRCHLEHIHGSSPLLSRFGRSTAINQYLSAHAHKIYLPAYGRCSILYLSRHPLFAPDSPRYTKQPLDSKM